jgi:electron transport complex protein RnfA
MAGLREQLEFSEVSSMAKGTALVLLVGGILSLSFMGFAGLGG